MALRLLWIAFQGLTIGLTEIVRAIQGLWPGDEEDETPVYVFGSGGGGGKARAAAASKADRYRAARARIERTNMDLIALTIALAEDFLQ